MKTINLSIDIESKPEQIWAAIIGSSKYKIWTAAFQGDSRFEGIWSLGAKLKFVADGPDGTPSGMVAEVVAFEHLKHISLKPVGLIASGVEDYESDELQIWKQTQESYFIEPVDEFIYKFRLEQIVPDEYFEDMNSMWKDALVKLKEVCELNLAPFHAITIETTVNSSIEQVWDYWTNPEHMVKWSFASDDWHCPKASMDLRVGGDWFSTMAAKDGSMAFDFGGTYTEVELNKRLVNQLGDGRMMWVDFEVVGPTEVKVVETFEAEGENTLDMQRAGWQAILNNFKKAVEEQL